MRVAVGRALAEHVERAPRRAEPAHAVVDAARAEPLLGDQEALALAAEQVLGRDADVVVDDLGVAAELAELLPSGCSIVGTSRRMFTPGVSAGTMIIDARWWGRASGSVTAMTIRKSAIDALEENHLRPLMT